MVGKYQFLESFAANNYFRPDREPVEKIQKRTVFGKLRRVIVKPFHERPGDIAPILGNAKVVMRHIKDGEVRGV